MTLNEQLKKLIEENTTQAEVAKKMGIHRQTLNDSLRRDLRRLLMPWDTKSCS